MRTRRRSVIKATSFRIKSTAAAPKIEASPRILKILPASGESICGRVLAMVNAPVNYRDAPLCRWPSNLIRCGFICVSAGRSPHWPDSPRSRDRAPLADAAVIYIDALMVKVRDGGMVQNKAAYLAVGVA